MQNAFFFLFLFPFFSLAHPHTTNHIPYPWDSSPALTKKIKNKLELLFKNTKTKPQFKVEIVAKNLGIPWGMTFLNDRELIWTEREGLVKKINILTGKVTVIKANFKNLYARGQGGLLDIALHPDFKKNKQIYFSYSISKKKQAKHSFS